MKTAGMRVGAILEADESTVKLLGYGTYEGDEVPDSCPISAGPILKSC